MSRELILIPKARYESLIREQELENEENKLPTFQHNKELVEKGELEKKIDNKSNTVDQIDTHAIEDTSDKVKIKRKKQKSDARKQNGGGQPYLTMSPKQFFNHRNKVTKQTSKKNWLSFPL